MTEFIDNTEIFDPNLKPLAEIIPIPEDNPRFLTELAMLSEADNDVGLAQIMDRRFRLAVYVTNGAISPKEFLEVDDRLRDDIRTLRQLKNQQP